MRRDDQFNFVQKDFGMCRGIPPHGPHVLGRRVHHSGLSPTWAPTAMAPSQGEAQSIWPEALLHKITLIISFPESKACLKEKEEEV